MLWCLLRIWVLKLGSNLLATMNFIEWLRAGVSFTAWPCLQSFHNSYLLSGTFLCHFSPHWRSTEIAGDSKLTIWTSKQSKKMQTHLVWSWSTKLPAKRSSCEQQAKRNTLWPSPQRGGQPQKECVRVGGRTNIDHTNAWSPLLFQEFTRMSQKMWSTSPSLLPWCP